MGYLKKAESAEFKIFYELKSEDSAIYWSGFLSAPDIENLRMYYNKNLDNIYFFIKGNDYVGYIQVHKGDNEIELSGPGVFEKHRGKKFGKEIIRAYIDEQYRERIPLVAYIREDNFPSVYSYSSNGFVKTEIAKMVYFSLENKEYLMEKYILKR